MRCETCVVAVQLYGETLTIAVKVSDTDNEQRKLFQDEQAKTTLMANLEPEPTPAAAANGQEVIDLISGESIDPQKNVKLS